MTKKTFMRIGILALLIIISVLLAVVYLINKPHRNVQSADVFAETPIEELLNEFTSDPARANEKYLSSDGNSKVLIVDGPVFSITTNQKNEKVILLKHPNLKVGVSCTFTEHTNTHILKIKIGEIVKIKGAITAGNSYDADLDLYTHAILIQCDLVK
jgi:hypothetical protein